LEHPLDVLRIAVWRGTVMGWLVYSFDGDRQATMAQFRCQRYLQGVIGRIDDQMLARWVHGYTNKVTAVGADGFRIDESTNLRVLPNNSAVWPGRVRMGL
jgi:hypothetical protein